ncbi:neurotrimin-like protein [Leptotrombidium deliense]|uniref:Neurotrimin-like protein n=1 Tax=Leptotrombidium deliense TaxID=299467 RepID=A0A443S0W5_9ACAR|nr:neurotrimin-like protein [Leptotrombidium deliense]
MDSMQKVDKGKSKSLFCNVLFAVPKASIIWKHKDVELTRCRDETKCIISNANSENSGEYSCTVDNGVGHPKIETFTLLIIQKPEIVMKQSKYLAQIDEDFIINFEVIGTPTPTVNWYFRSTNDRESLLRGKDYEYVCHNEQCSLKISKIKEKQLGTYVVKAVNDVSSTPVLRQVKVEGSPPSNVQINVPDFYRDNDVLKAKILMSAQSSVPILRFEAKYFSLDREYWKHTLEGTENDLDKSQFHVYQKEVFIDPLNYDKEYKIEAKFQNKFGWSELSVITFRTNDKSYYPKNTV